MYLLTFLLPLLSIFSSTEAPTATDPQQLFLSTDSGNSWQPFGEGLPEGVMPRDIVETETRLIMTTRSEGVFALTKSPIGQTDNCHWVSISKGLPEGIFINDLLVQDQRLVLGTYESGVFVSSDGGANWRRPIFNLKVSVNSFVLDEDGVILAATDAGIHHSFDMGETWHLKEKIYRIRHLAMHNGNLVATRQNTVGTIKDGVATWSAEKTDWAINQPIPGGEYLYARTSKGQMIRTKDGLEMEKASSLNMYMPGVPANATLPEALWHGLKVKLPGNQDLGVLKETSIGWFAGIMSGC
ncbi:MAG: photosystem II stability/assembly factor-like uncharacterized protein [Neolewinella sp.]|jgi:photosystem II stability/assembly factor-like uncharacterized protein